MGEYDRMRRTKIVGELPYFEQILDAFKCRQGRVRILKLAPGAGIDLHRDIRHEAANFAIGKVRLHVPIYTNDKVKFHVAGEEIKMGPGRLYYVNFSKPHFVRNNGTEDRVHLVLDLEVNSWLASVFPKSTVAEKIEHKADSLWLPIYWEYLRYRTAAIEFFWRKYNDSSLQRLRHCLFPKKKDTA